MLFNSIDFALFFPIVFALYWFVFNKSIRWQNGFVVAASYFFYGFWDWRFLILLIFSTLVDFVLGILISKQENQRKRKLLLIASIITNIGLLGFFKYYNFFLDNFITAFSFFGTEINTHSLNIILPLGISFYTFQTLSYTIDIYRKKIDPSRDIFAFSAFVSFFPQLVAGPIERASNLLPQFKNQRTFDYSKAVDGLRQILWGLFKKIVIADNCAEYANQIFNNSTDYSGSTLLLGALFFAFQIYGDFSGYSDIAIGSARLLGIDLMRNFAFPYFSRDIAEFWRRWHISLSTWFRDYVYIPLGGSQGGTWMKIRNTFIIFLVSGFWHGANWTFIVWGALNALFFLPLILTNSNRNNLDIISQNSNLPKLNEVLMMLGTFLLTVLAWIFFRAENLTHAFSFLGEIFSSSLFKAPEVFSLETIILIVILLAIEWMGRTHQHALAHLGLTWKRDVRFIFYYVIVFAILWFAGEEQEFIYFQF
jgi:alginate O-acetyltransferase complex protein AlgI